MKKGIDQLTDWITAAEARCRRASCGPWHHLPPEIPFLVYGRSTSKPPIISSEKRSVDDMAFVVAARTDLPNSLALLRKALELIEAQDRYMAMQRVGRPHEPALSGLSRARSAFDAMVKDTVPGDHP